MENARVAAPCSVHAARFILVGDRTDRRDLDSGESCPRREARASGATGASPRCGPRPRGGGGSQLVRVHLGSEGGGGARLHRRAAGSGRERKHGTVRTDRDVLGPGGWGHVVLEPTVLAGTGRPVRHRDRLHVARRIRSGHGNQSRGEAALVLPCVRAVERRQSGSQDGRKEHAVACCDRGARCTVRGRPTKLVAVVGSGRRGSATRLGHLLGDRVGVAGMSGAAGAATGETASPSGGQASARRLDPLNRCRARDRPGASRPRP